MKHLLIKGDRHAPTLVLLHGTGGDEYSLVSLAKTVLPQANILALRGGLDVLGLLRFYHRNMVGEEVIDHLSEQAAEVAAFIKEASKTYQLPLDNMILFGFSNGADIATHLLTHDDFHRAVLLFPYYPYALTGTERLQKKRAFVAMGEHDPMSNMDKNHALLYQLDAQHLSYQLVWGQGHQVTPDIAEKLTTWLSTLVPNN